MEMHIYIHTYELLSQYVRIDTEIRQACFGWMIASLCISEGKGSLTDSERVGL